MKHSLVLASSSIFRRELLERLHIPFTTASPQIDESRLPEEKATDMVQRLALAKAQALASSHPQALIIGSDQCAVLGERILGKPGDHVHAVAQLQAASGQQVEFLTGLCLYDSQAHTYQLAVEPFNVFFRDLSQAEIEHYLRREQPYNCAGSFKSEGLGISLFERLAGDDPNALIGLPLIRLMAMLRHKGWVIPAPLT